MYISQSYYFFCIYFGMAFGFRNVSMRLHYTTHSKKIRESRLGFQCELNFFAQFKIASTFILFVHDKVKILSPYMRFFAKH